MAGEAPRANPPHAQDAPCRASHQAFRTGVGHGRGPRAPAKAARRLLRPRRQPRGSAALACTGSGTPGRRPGFRRLPRHLENLDSPLRPRGTTPVTTPAGHPEPGACRASRRRARAERPARPSTAGDGKSHGRRARRLSRSCPRSHRCAPACSPVRPGGIPPRRGGLRGPRRRAGRGPTPPRGGRWPPCPGRRT